MPLSEYQRYSQVSRSSSKRSPVAAIGDRPAARLEDADPDRRRQWPGQIRQIVERDRQLRLAVLVGHRRLDIAPVGGELFVGQAELKVRVVRVRVVVEGDHRLGLGPQTRPGRAIVVMCGNLDLEGLGGADRLLRGRQLHRELRRDEILDPKLGRANRRRLRIEAQLDLPGADARVARQREALMIRSDPIALGVRRE